MATTDPAIEIERLKAQVKALEARLAKAKYAFTVLEKQQRDRLTAAVMGGLAARWSWGGDGDGTSAERLATKGEQLVNAVMRQRELWLLNLSENQPQDAAQKASK